MPRPIEHDDNDRRTVLVHLNVDAPAWDDRSAEEVAHAILGAIEVGSDDESMSGLIVAVALAEDIA